MYAPETQNSHEGGLGGPDDLKGANKGERTMTTTKTVSQAKPKTRKSTKETAAATVAKMRQASLEIPAPSAPPSELAIVPLALIETREQVRTVFDDEALRELAQDIAERGMLQPVLLRPNPEGQNYLVIAGERRIRAARLANLGAVPAIIGEADDDTAAAMQLAENIQRVDLRLAEEAAAVRKLYDIKGGSVTAVAEHLHKSKAWVSKRLAASHPDLHWRARRLIEDGITEDLEIVLAVDKIAQLDYYEANKIGELIEKGEAGRQTVREKLDEVKAEAARRENAQAKAEADRNDPAKIEERKRQQEELERRNQEERERQQESPEYLRYFEIDGLDEDQRAIMIPYLEGIHRSGASASDRDFRLAVIRSKRLDNKAMSKCELAAYIAGYTGHPFSLDNLAEEIAEANGEGDEDGA